MCKRFHFSRVLKTDRQFLASKEELFLEIGFLRHSVFIKIVPVFNFQDIALVIQYLSLLDLQRPNNNSTQQFYKEHHFLVNQVRITRIFFILILLLTLLCEIIYAHAAKTIYSSIKATFHLTISMRVLRATRKIQRNN